MKRCLFMVIVLVSLMQPVYAQPLPYSQQMAETAMNLWPDSFSLKPGRAARWSYDQGVILKGIESIWKLYGDAKYFDYIQHSMEHYVREDGSVKDYRIDEYNIDHVNNGKVLMFLHDITAKEKYRKAIQNMRNQLKTHPRTKEGSFWHKQIYPWQVWLDGLYMGQPFYAEYARNFGEDTAFNDIARQFIQIEKHTRDTKTGLLYHGWDESREQKWADKQTGNSPHFWGRALGWYGVALVDVLDYFPPGHPGKDSIIGILKRFAKAVAAVQDRRSGVWYDIVNLPNQPKNYKEASASAMLVYTIAKGVRNGYLPAHYLTNAQKGYEGIIREFIEVDDKGQTNLKGTVTVSGLGGKPYRDGSYEYYMSEPVIVNDPKGIGAFILCSVEMEMAALPKPGKNKKVVLDTYYNNEWRKNMYGQTVRRHYTWDDTEHGGFSFLGGIFKSYGATLHNLGSAPTVENLKNASVYIIVDPDGLKDNKQPNYMEEPAAKNIAAWVKSGGVLLLMANDSANCDLAHFNKLANLFGIKFTSKSVNMVNEDQYDMGSVLNSSPNAVFKMTRKMYLKEVSVLETKPPAIPLIQKDRDIIFATAKYGKGAVIAVGDPWIYNEYVDGRKIPVEYENFLAANELVQWLLEQAKPQAAKYSNNGTTVRRYYKKCYCPLQAMIPPERDYIQHNKRSILGKRPLSTKIISKHNHGTV